MPPWEIRVDPALLTRIASAVAEHRAVTVVGPVGIGKTTLVRAAIEATKLRPFWLVGVGDQRPRSAVDAICELPADTSVADAAMAAAERLAGARGVLIVENIDLLDAESVTIANAIAQTGRVSVVRILTASTSEAGVSGEVVVEVAPLDRLVIADLVEAYVGGRVTSGTVTVLRRLSGGVPFIVRQLVEGAVQAGTLATADDELWTLSAGPVAITTELQELIDDVDSGVPAALRAEARRGSMGELEELRIHREELGRLRDDRSPAAAGRRTRLAWELGEAVTSDALLDAARGALLDTEYVVARDMAAAALERGSGSEAAIAGSWARVLAGATDAVHEVIVSARGTVSTTDAASAEIVHDVLRGDWTCALRRGRRGDAPAVLSMLVEAEALCRQGEIERPRALVRSLGDGADLPRLAAIVGVERALIALDLADGLPRSAYDRGAAVLDRGLPGGLVDAVVLPEIVSAAAAIGRLDQALRLALDALDAADHRADGDGDGALMLAAAAQATRLLILRGRPEDAQRIAHRYANVSGSLCLRATLSAWSGIARGELLKPAQSLRTAALAARREGLVPHAAELLHQAIMLGDREAAAQLVTGPFAGEGTLLRLRKAHAKAVLSGDAAMLDAVADGFEDRGSHLVALDVRAQAISELRRSGRRRSADGRMEALQRLRARCWNPVTPALIDVDTDSRLTAREREVLASQQTGLTVDATARRLGMARETVATHLARARGKLPAG